MDCENRPLDSSLYITAFIYKTKQKRTLISDPVRGLLGFISFPKAIDSYFDVLLDNVFKMEQKVKYKWNSGITE